LKTRTGRNRLFVVNKKVIRIAAIALAVVVVIIVISTIVSSGKKSAVKHAAVEKLESVGVINVGLRGDLGPLCMYDSDTASYKGLEKDISDEVLKRIFQGNIIINFVEVDSETKDALLVTEDLDMSLGASIKGTTSGIDYTVSYLSDGSAFLVRKGEQTSQSQLSGTTIAVVQGTLEAAKVGKDKKTMNIENYFKSENINAAIKTYASYPEAIEALRVKFVSAVCAPETFLKLFGKSGMVLLSERFMPSNYCIQTRSSLEGFSGEVNDQLAAMESDGTMDSLIQKWNFPAQKK
jgi:ABC-type amino acid transport substrate-binding protein